MNYEKKEIKGVLGKVNWLFIIDIMLIIAIVGMAALCSVKLVRDDMNKDPLEEGSHLGYQITCENGFKYKIFNDKRGVILLLDKDGKPLKCK